MKKIIIIFITIFALQNIVYAHGGNITGYKDKDSDKITISKGKYYGYHSKDGIRHYHEVEWNNSLEKWVIVDTDTYYNSNFEKTTYADLSKNDYETEKIEVTYVAGVDGDTAKFSYNGETITTRFLAVDTPESVHPTKEVQAFGVEASNFTKETLNNAKKIELEFDNNSDKTDKYGRYLAWIWVDGELLQNILVEKGLAQVAYLYGNYKYVDMLKETQEKATKNKIGIWSLEENNSLDGSDLKGNNEEVLANTSSKELNDIMSGDTLSEVQNDVKNYEKDYIYELIFWVLIIISVIYKKIVLHKK